MSFSSSWAFCRVRSSRRSVHDAFGRILTRQWRQIFQPHSVLYSRICHRTRPAGTCERFQASWSREERTTLELQAAAALVCYEMTSKAGMLAQLGIPLDSAPEASFLVKVRDRVLSHPDIARVQRGLTR